MQPLTDQSAATWDTVHPNNEWEYPLSADSFDPERATCRPAMNPEEIHIDERDQ